MMSNLLPQGWAYCSISDIAIINPKTEAEETLMAGFVPMSHAPTSYHGVLGVDEKPWGEIKKAYTNFQNGDVIFAKVTPCFENGKAAIAANLPNNIGAGSSEFYVLRPYSCDISEKLLFAIIKSHTFMQEGAANMTGAVGLRRVPKSFVESFPVALPPVEEQKEIANRLDTLLAQVEATQVRLARIPEILKRFRQSVLSDAVSGKLTVDWREKNDRLHWKTLSLETIAKIIDPHPSHRTPKAVDGGVPYIGIGDIKPDGQVDFENARKVSRDVLLDHQNRYTIKDGDFIFGKIGTLGNATILPIDTEYTLSANVILIQPISSEVVAAYIKYYLTSPAVMNDISQQSNSTSQAAFGIKKMRAFQATMPSLEEQTEIVRRVEQLFAYSDTIEQQAKAAKARVDNLTQSILAKAFRGELTADWRAANPGLISGENSAEALLTSIQKERAAASGIKGKRGTRKISATTEESVG